MQQVHALQKFLEACIRMQDIQPRISIYECHRCFSRAVGPFQIGECLVILTELGVQYVDEVPDRD